VVDDALLDAFARCARDPEADEVRLAVLVARTLDGTLQDAEIDEPLTALAAARPLDQPPWDYLLAVGFAGDVPGYAHLDNSNLARVLQRRRGIPITLGIVLLAVARHAGYRARGVNFPGHFLVEVDGVLIDPFLMAPVTHEQCTARLPAEQQEVPWPRLFAPATPLAVGLRMLNNVRQGYVRQGLWLEALGVIDAQLRLAPQQPALHLERGELWLRLGLRTPAREAFTLARDMAEGLSIEDGQVLRTMAATRLAQLGDADDVVH
jgi:regulator of sirC expression with transglutaminase-like and TPR domain